MTKFKIILLVLISLCIGILIGGYLFSQSQPRSFLAINRCQNCLTHKDLLGLLASDRNSKVFWPNALQSF